LFADLLKTDKNELLALWLADQVTTVVDDEQKVANKAHIAKQNLVVFSKVC
jgi:acyl-homoserine lactone acylase PvdQ